MMIKVVDIDELELELGTTTAGGTLTSAACTEISLTFGTATVTFAGICPDAFICVVAVLMC